MLKNLIIKPGELSKNKLNMYNLVLDTFDNIDTPYPYNEIFMINTKKNKREQYFTCDIDNVEKILKKNKNISGRIFEKNTFKPIYYGVDNIYKFKFSKNVKDDISRLYSILCDNNYELSKLYDCSMIKVYFYKDTWCFSTNRGLIADKVFWRSSKSFEKILLEIFEKNNFDYKAKLNKNYVYTFMLYHPETFNRIKSKSCKVRIINIFDTENEKNIEFDEYLPFESVYIIEKCSFNDWVETLTYIKPEYEYFEEDDEIGFVIRNPENNVRIKVCNLQYNSIINILEKQNDDINMTFFKMIYYRIKNNTDDRKYKKFLDPLFYIRELDEKYTEFSLEYKKKTKNNIEYYIKNCETFDEFIQHLISLNLL